MQMNQKRKATSEILGAWLGISKICKKASITATQNIPPLAYMNALKYTIGVQDNDDKRDSQKNMEISDLQVL